MPIYIYKGYDLLSGSAKKGKIEAESPRAARQKLKSKNQIIASEMKEEVALTKGEKKSSLFSAKKASMQDITIMTRQFATLQKAHVPLDECLKALTQQVESPVLRNALASVKDSVSEGKSLADGLADFPSIFSRLYINMVRAGETSGNLGLVLERLADFLEYQVAVQGKIFSALSYPLLMISASVLIIGYLFISVIPKLEKVFASLQVSLPWYSELLINFSKFLQNQWYLVLGGGAAVVVLFQKWAVSKSGSQTLDRSFLKLPLFGPLILRINVSNFTKTLSTLLGSGVPIISALEITKNTIGNSVIANVVEDSKVAVREGEALWATIEKSGRFPPLVVHMIRTGEKTGDLEQMLKHVADAYDAEVSRKIDSMISLIEPLMIIVMGAIVVVVVVAMLVPMLSIMSQMRS